jgi:Pyruvate:ferredoxin oxidoreductase and related 2-oxoacid:ferredoxin oxidoreductases, alpha subunit
VAGDRERRLIKSVFEEAEDQEQFNIEQAGLYKTWQSDLMVEEYQVEDAEYVYAAYGICARIARTSVDELRRQGYKVGLIRPVTLYPFPEYSFARLDPMQVKGILIAEMTIPSQMIDDVRLGVSRDIPLATFGRSGGVVMQEEELTEAMLRMIQEKSRA